MSQPHPGAYDVYSQVNHVRCTGSYCTEDYGPAPTHHALTQAQIDALPFPWTTDPLSCWDGSAAPCPFPLPGGRDLAYRARMHAYPGAVAVPGTTHAWPDSNAWSELSFTGSRDSHAYFNRHFGEGDLAGRRYLGVFRFSYAERNGSGQSGSRTHVWANNSDPQIMTGFTHETGHNLGLAHPHENRSVLFDGPFTSVGKCTTNGTCPTAADCRCTPCVDSSNPVAATIMNYRCQNGFRVKEPALPVPSNTCFPGCGWTRARFSKGTNPALVELQLGETLALSLSAVKFAQDGACYDEFGDSQTCSVLGLGPAGSCANAPQTCNPWCDPVGCYFDHDRNGQLTPIVQTTTWDSSRGPFVQGPTCTSDTLTDVDEWRRMVAAGKQDLATMGYNDYSMLRMSFNGGPGAVDCDDWGYPITTTATIDDATYERNMCLPGGACAPGQTCSLDTCTQVGQCTVGCDLAAGVCTCSGPEDCKSRICDGGLCSTARGTCTCAVDNDCVSHPILVESKCLVGSLCGTTRIANFRPPEATFRNLRESAKFDGQGSQDAVVLTHTGADSPFTSIASGDVIRVQLMFRWDGFQTTQLQYIVRSQAFRLAVGNIGLGPMLWAKTSGTSGGDLLWGPLQRHRWYFVNWVSANLASVQWLEVRPWDLRQGWYQTLVPAQHCVRNSVADDMPDPGNIVLGGDPQDHTYDFNGRIDSVSVANFRVGTGLPPMGCVAQ